MKLIIDCGSTKADWVILNGNNIVLSFNTEGFNPNYTDKDTISSIVLNNTSYQTYIQGITDIYFYGTGCGNQDNCNIIKDIFQSIFFNAKISVTHDLMAACHALFGDKNGIACILGTGSHSCHYDGEEIVNKAVSLGYIIGDDGLIEEARSMYPKRHLNSLNTVGYKEVFEYFDGKVSLGEAIENIKINTRQYAKRQMTWLRKNNDYKWFTVDEQEEMLKYINAVISGESDIQ